MSFVTNSIGDTRKRSSLICLWKRLFPAERISDIVSTIKIYRLNVDNHIFYFYGEHIVCKWRSKIL